MANTLIMFCSCKSTAQDTMYGPGLRVHNALAQKTTSKSGMTHRCTVCGKDKRA